MENLTEKRNFKSLEEIPNHFLKTIVRYELVETMWIICLTCSIFALSHFYMKPGANTCQLFEESIHKIGNEKGNKNEESLWAMK